MENKPVKKNKQIPKQRKEEVLAAKKSVPTKNKSFRYLAWIIFFFALIIYGNNIFNQYSLDDYHVARNNKEVRQGISAIPKMFTSLYEQKGNLAYGYRPLPKVTFALEFSLFGSKPLLSHFINDLLYALTCLLLYRFLRKIFISYHPYFAFVVAMLFAAHPIHTEVVDSLKNREELLSFLFGIGVLSYAVNYARMAKIKYILLGVLCFMLAYLSKPSAIAFIALVPLTLYFFTESSPRKLLYFFLGILVLGLIMQYVPKLFLPHTERALRYFENPVAFEHNILLRIGTALYTLYYYLRLLIFPHPLISYYGFNLIPTVGLANFWVWVSLLVHGGIFYYALRNFKKKTILSYAILFYLISIAMFSNFVVLMPGIVAERLVFTASFGFCIALGYLLFLLFKQEPSDKKIAAPALNKVIFVMIILLIPYSAKTFARNKQWRTDFSLYSNDIKYAEESVKMNDLYASELVTQVHAKIREGNKGPEVTAMMNNAIKHYKKVVELDPKHYWAYNNLGQCYWRFQGKFDSAQIYLKKALEIKPDFMDAMYNLCGTYEVSKNYAEAEKTYLKMIKMMPKDIKIRSMLSNMYDAMGDFDKAIQTNEEMKKIFPDSYIPDANIASLYLRRDDTLNTIKYWEQAVKVHPQSDLCMNLQSFYRGLGDLAKADYYYQKAQDAKKMEMNQNQQ